MQFLYSSLVLIASCIIAWLIIKRYLNTEQQFLRQSNADLKIELEKKQVELRSKEEQIIQLSSDLAVSNNNLQNTEGRLVEYKQEITTVKEQFTREFENLANRIFEEKSAKFSEQNQINLSNILTPLGQKIKDFEKKVEDTYNAEGRERATLKEQIRSLTELNQLMSSETKNLTLALKGDSKTQGNWGEMILESILEKSGLVKDREYTIQVAFANEDGKRYQPDVVVNLPENKVLIIDSKVSLTAYERFIASDDDIIRALAGKEHILSFRNHIKNLGSKNYHNLYKIQSLDFVLMFIPIESAFALAIQKDGGLFDEALSHNIVLVCPSTLLATMKTVASIWRAEKSTQNANEIAKIGGVLYDRLVGFVTSMELVDLAIKSSQIKYNDALTKLSGNQGVIKSALKLKELGAKTSKILVDINANT